MLELHKVMALSLLPLIRLVSNKCRVAQMAVGLVKNHCEIYELFHLSSLQKYSRLFRESVLPRF